MSRLKNTSFLLLWLALFECAVAEVIEIPVPETSVFSMTYSPDGKLLAVGTGGQNPSARIFDVSSKKELYNWPCERRGAGFSVVFSPNGKQIAIADFDLAILIRDVSNGSEIAVLPGDPDRRKYRQAKRLAWLPDNQSLVAGYSTGEIFVWDVNTRKTKLQFDHANSIAAIAVTSDGGRIATGTAFGVRIWNAENGKPIVQFDQKKTGAHEVNAVAFLSDGKIVVTADNPGYVRFFSTLDGKERNSFKMPAVGRSTTVPALVLSTDGKTVVVPGLISGMNPDRPQLLDTGILVLDGVIARPKMFLPSIQAGVLAVSPDGKTLAAATGDSGDPVVIYNLADAVKVP